MFILNSSDCKSLQCLISTLTQGGKGGHLFRLTCSVVLWGGRNIANKHYWRVLRVLTMYGPHRVCPSSWRHVLSWSTLLRLQVALQGYCPKRTLHFMHFPGLSCSGLGSHVLRKCTDLVGCTFFALPRSEQLRQPGAWRAHPPRWAVCLNHFSGPSHLVSRVHRKSTISGLLCVSSGELISGLDPPGSCQQFRIPGRRGQQPGACSQFG